MAKFHDLLVPDENFEDFMRAYNSYTQGANQREIEDFFNLLKNDADNQVFVKKSISTDVERVIENLTADLESHNQVIHGALVTVFVSIKVDKDDLLNHYSDPEIFPIHPMDEMLADLLGYYGDELANFAVGNVAFLWNFARQEKWPDEFIEIILIYS